MATEGQAAPDFTLHDQDGHPQSLAGMRGSPVVLYFSQLAVALAHWPDRTTIVVAKGDLQRRSGRPQLPFS